MNVLALGGAGDMGRMAITTLLNSSAVSSITVADKNKEVAGNYVELVKSDKLSAVEIDVTDHDELVELIIKHDLVMNTVGPYYKFEKMIVEACIEAKRHCVDINDDWQPMLEVLELSQKAKDAGIAIITGIGSSPGLMNLMAVMASTGFDSIDEVVTAWGLASGKSGPPQKYHVSRKLVDPKAGDRANAAIEHMLHECVGKIPTFRNGKVTEIEALTEAAPFVFPGFDDAYVCHIGHPEPVTLPRVIKANSISNVVMFGRHYSEAVMRFAQKIKSGQLTIQQASIEFEKESKEIFTRPEVLQEISTFPPTLAVTVTGKKNNAKKMKAIGLTHTPHGQMAGVSGVPLAITALLINEGKIDITGVLSPEEALDPLEFFNRFAVYCGENLTLEDIFLQAEVDI